MADDPWATDIPGKYQPGQIVKGPVTKITNFGVFVGLENGLEGLLHISELADHKVEDPEEIVKVGEIIEVKVLRVDAEERKIGLSRKRVEWAEEEVAAAGAAAPMTGAARPTTPAFDLKGGVGDGGGPLFRRPVREEPASADKPAESVESAEE
jgi:small subunit ribosomal protein S1